MKLTESRDLETPEPDQAPPAAAEPAPSLFPPEPAPSLFGHRLAPPPDLESTQRVPRPPPVLPPLPTRWRRNALAAAVLLGLVAGTILAMSPPPGLAAWLQKAMGRFTDQGARPASPPAASGAPSRAPAPPATAEGTEEAAGEADGEPSEAAAGKAPPAAGRPAAARNTSASAGVKARAKARAIAKARKAADRRRAGRARARLPADQGVEVELF